MTTAVFADALAAAAQVSFSSNADFATFSGAVSGSTIHSGGGADTLRFGAMTTAVFADNLGTGAQVSFSSVGDFVSFSGSIGAASIFGGGGNDSLRFTSTLNRTTLSGGADADQFLGSVTIGASAVSFWGGSGNDTFNFSSFTGAGAGSTAYFWNDKTGYDSIVFGSIVSGGSGSSYNAAGVAFGITASSGLAISFTTAQTSASFGTGISNLFKVGTSNVVSFGINSDNYISLSFGNGAVISLQGFESAEAIAITNTFGLAGKNAAGLGTGLFGTVLVIPTFS
jgi:hypothetical protein